MNFNKNLELFKIYLESKKNVCIVGKGKLEKPIPDHFDTYIGIKQSISICPSKDIFVLNDFEGVFGLESIFKDIKFILCPYKPHVHWKVCDITYNNIYNYAKLHGFKGKMVVYELWTNRKRKIGLSMIHSFNSADIILYFFKKYKLTEININYYGVCNAVEENEKIKDFILNANIIDTYKDIYNSYVERTFGAKKDRSIIVKNAHKLIQKKIYKDFNDFKITFN